MAKRPPCCGRHRPRPRLAPTRAAGQPHTRPTIDDLATVAESAEKTGMDGVFFDLQLATTSPNEVLDTAAALATTIGLSAAE